VYVDKAFPDVTGEERDRWVRRLRRLVGALSAAAAI
jgi:hypothetical protein